jgi:cellulose synthase/poly-beta-1,6-N-acetylglucosamine synthase-like glycosyltransferase
MEPHLERQLRRILVTLVVCSFITAFIVGALTDLQSSWPILTILIALGFLDFSREVLFLAGSFVDRIIKYLELFRKRQDIGLPLVSVIMPAFNEEVCIAEALSNMYEIDYPNYEIVFIDDGSSDMTLTIAQEVATLFPHVPTTVLSQPNAGKSAALNSGILHANGEFVLCVDADSKIHPQTIHSGIRHFSASRVAAVGGFVSIGNRDNWLTWFQHLEYLLNIQFFRRTLSLFGLVSVVPGPVGLFRRSAILSVGGYVTGHQSFAEDAELTMRMLASGWTIKSDENMISVTEAPATIDAFLRQRYRWIRGMYQATWANLGKIAERGRMGRFLALHLIWDTTVSPLLNGILTMLFLGSIVRGFNSHLIEVWVAYSLALELVKTLLVSRTAKELGVGLITLLPRRLFFTYVLQTWALLCLLDEWLDKEMTWDKLDRTGQMGSIA